MIDEHLRRSELGAYIELFVLDLSSIGGAGNLAFTPNINEDHSEIQFAGMLFTPLPCEFTGAERSMEGALPNPTIKVSNVSKFLMGQVISHDSLIGAKLTRMQTFEDYLDTKRDGTPNPDADSTMRLPDESYIINQLDSMTNAELSFTMISVLEHPNAKLPRRIITRDPLSYDIGTEIKEYRFPNISRTGSRSR